METFSIIFGAVALLVCFAVLLYRLKCFTLESEQAPLFNMYLLASALLGMGEILIGYFELPFPLDVFASCWMISWVPISALVTFLADRKWSPFPISYIVACPLVCLQSLLSGNDAIQPVRPFMSVVAFGLLVIVGSIATFVARKIGKR